jgi:phenylacetate-CoA ligase
LEPERRGSEIDPFFLGRLLWHRHLLARRGGWTRERILRHQSDSLLKLRAHALARSPFYRDFHRGLENAPLHALPVLTKSLLMENFDALATAPGVTLAAVEGHLRLPSPPRRFLGRYVLSATSGTTGRKGLFAHDPEEWAWIVASYVRANDWSGMRAGVTRPIRLAVVSTRTTWHQSCLVGASLEGPFVPTLRLDATEPMEALVRGLGAFRPQSLTGYPSVLARLADEQISGRLDIRPETVMTAAEAMAPEDRARIRQAWGKEPFDIYGATETAGIASECPRHHGLHLYEDLVIAENVDHKHRPVPLGEEGEKLLVTVLFSRTLPLIRYELSDRVRFSDRSCDCGLPFRLLEGIEGREEDVIHLSGATGDIAVHPNVFHNHLEPLPVKAWQVTQEKPDAILILLAGPPAGFDPRAAMAGLEKELAGQGAAAVSLRWEIVPEIPRGPNGKLKLVRRLFDPGA